jgi:hypothetical protein
LLLGQWPTFKQARKAADPYMCQLPECSADVPASGSLVSMGLLIDYFVAASDVEARTVLDHGLGGRFASTDGSGVEPTAVLGQFEELLTGRTFDDQLEDPASYAVIASSEDNDVAHCKIIR